MKYHSDFDKPRGFKINGKFDYQGMVFPRHGKFVLDRIQSAGPGDLKIEATKIYEMGSYTPIIVGQELPDIKFDLEDFKLNNIKWGKNGTN